MPESLYKGEFLDDATTVNTIINTPRVSDSENSKAEFKAAVGLSEESDIKFGVGMSQEWDPYKAGVQAASKALSHIGYKPKFLLVFSTIHYAKEKGGLKAMLKGCRDLIDDVVPSIGGTITGFICPEGCFTRGVVVVAGGGEGIDVASAYANNIRGVPHMAGKRLANEIKKKLSNSKKSKKILIELMSGPIEPNFMTHPILRQLIKRVPYPLLCFTNSALLSLAMRYFHYGPSTEEDVLNTLGMYLNKYTILGCSTFDDMKCLYNYQFYDSNVMTDSIVAIGLRLDEEIISGNAVPLIPTGKNVDIHRGSEGYSICYMNDNTAASQYIKEMGWPKDYIKIHVEDITKKTFYYAMGFRENETLYAFPAGFYFDEVILTNRKIRSDKVELLVTSSEKTIGDFKKNISEFGKNSTIFTLVNGGMNILGMLGGKVDILKDILDENLINNSYLVIFGSGEHIKKSEDSTKFTNYSMDFLSIKKQKDIELKC